MMWNISTTWIFKELFPTLGEQTVITEFMQKSVDNWFDRYLANRPTWWQKMVMQFSMLSKTPLHVDFRKKICEPDRDRTIKEETERIEKEMHRNLQSMYDNDPEQDYKYERINRFHTIDDNFLRIWVAEITKEWRTKRHKTLVISQKKTPKLYLLFMT